MNQFTTSIIWMLSFFIFTLMHELGHAAMSRILFGDKNWVIHMGAGRPIFTSKRLVINLWFFFGGFVRCSTNSGKRYMFILRSAGGFSVNILLAILIFVSGIIFGPSVLLNDSLPTRLLIQFMNISFTVNIIIAISTMLPIVYPLGPLKGKYSDGMWIWRMLTNPSKYFVNSE